MSQPLAANNVIEMARACLREIRVLQELNAQLMPKADAYDLLSKVVHGMAPRESCGAGISIVWQLENTIKEIEDLQKVSDPVETVA